MTLFAVAGLVLLGLLGLLAYAVAAMTLLAVDRRQTRAPTSPVPLVEAQQPRWTALDDQQVARFLNQSPP